MKLVLMDCEKIDKNAPSETISPQCEPELTYNIISYF